MAICLSAVLAIHKVAGQQHGECMQLWMFTSFSPCVQQHSHLCFLDQILAYSEIIPPYKPFKRSYPFLFNTLAMCVLLFCNGEKQWFVWESGQRSREFRRTSSFDVWRESMWADMSIHWPNAWAVHRVGRQQQGVSVQPWDSKWSLLYVLGNLHFGRWSLIWSSSTLIPHLISLLLTQIGSQFVCTKPSGSLDQKHVKNMEYIYYKITMAIAELIFQHYTQKYSKIS